MVKSPVRVPPDVFNLEAVSVRENVVPLNVIPVPAEYVVFVLVSVQGTLTYIFSDETSTG